MTWQVGQAMPGGFTFAGWTQMGGKWYPLVKRPGGGTAIHPAYQAGATPPRPVATTPTPTSTATPTGATAGGQQAAPAAPPTITFTPPAMTGPTQAQIAGAKQQAALAVAGLNAERDSLLANGFGRFNAQRGLIDRDARIGKHDYNAQSNASGFRRSGGVNTNNRVVNAAAESQNLNNYNTLGQGRIDAINLNKGQIIGSTIQQLLGNIGADVYNNTFGSL